jgi:5-hydroxyisourate hydrolase
MEMRRTTRSCLLVLIGSIGFWTAVGDCAASAENLVAASRLSTHVLNTTTGQPASGVLVVLQRQAGQNWEELKRAETDGRGRVSDLHLPEKALQVGTYRFVFETGKYFESQGTSTFFPRVEIIFAIEKTDEHYHVPLLISPYGYSTYRGS